MVPMAIAEGLTGGRSVTELVNKQILVNTTNFKTPGDYNGADVVAIGEQSLTTRTVTANG